MFYDPERITYFGQTDFRNKKVPFGIKAKDRTNHVYVIGKTGMGKSTMLENMAVQDMRNGEGFAFIDPHGATAEKLLEYVPKERIKDVLYFAPFDMAYPISFNVMEDVGPDKRHLVANGLMSAFKKIWVDAWSARMEYILNNTILALLEYPGSTIVSINRMFGDKNYRDEVVSNIQDTAVKAFWTEEFANYTDRFAAEATPAIQNKVGQFISNPLIRNIVGQSTSSFDLREMMDNGKIFIVNLSKGRMGEDNANLLGSMLITKIYLAAMSRADTAPAQMKELPNFYLYVDEFQSFANESFANILSEARKYKLNLTIAHQYIEQMSEEVRAAVFGNVGTMMAFRVGAFDAEVLEKEFAPDFTAEDLVNLGFAQIYLKLMIDGVSSAPFSATTLPPLAHPSESFVEEVVEYTRNTYAFPRDKVESDIRSWHEHKFPKSGGGGGGGSGGSSGSGGGNDRGGNKKKKKIPTEEREKGLLEAISLATLKDSKHQNVRDDKKGPSRKNVESLKNVVFAPDEGLEKGGDDDGFVPLEELMKNSSRGKGDGIRETEEAQDAGADYKPAEAPKAPAQVSPREDREPRQRNEEVKREVAEDGELEELRRKKAAISGEPVKEKKDDSPLSGLKNVVAGMFETQNDEAPDDRVSDANGSGRVSRDERQEKAGKPKEIPENELRDMLRVDRKE